MNEITRILDVGEVNVGLPERSLTLAVALPLLLLGLVRLPFKALLALGAGAYLLWRGLRGYCFVYDWLGINTAVPAPKPRLNSNGRSYSAASTAAPSWTTQKETT